MACVKMLKVAACVAGFFLGWVVFPAGGLVVSLGVSVAWRILSTVFYGLFFFLAVWRFTWLIGICYKIGNGARKHWCKRHEYIQAAKMWYAFKKMELMQHRQQRQSTLESQLAAVVQQREVQQQQPPASTGAAPAYKAPPPPATPTQAAGSAPTARSSATAPAPAPATTTQTPPPDFLNFLGAMQDQMTEYDRAYGLPAGTGLQLLQQQQQQQQQQGRDGSQGLYPRIDSDALAGTVTV